MRHLPRPATLDFRRRVAIGFVLAAALVLLVTAVSAAALKIAVESDRLAQNHAEELVALGDLRAALEHRVAAFRGFLLTGEPDLLERLRQARSEVVVTLRRIRRGSSGERAALVEAVERANRAYDEKVAGGAALRQAGASAAELGWYIEQATRPQREALERALGRYLAHEWELLRAAGERAARGNLRASTVILASGGAAFLLLLGLSLPVGRTLSSLYDTERRARARAEAAERRSAFLAQASAVLASSLDYPSTLASMAELSVPELGDWCIVDVADVEGRLQRLAIRHVDPAKMEVVRKLTALYPDRQDQPCGPGSVLRTGKAEYADRITEEMLRAVSKDEAHYAMLRDLGFRSYMSVPLSARGRTIGVLTFVSAESHVRYGPEDVEFVQDLARRVSLAIDNARLYQEAREAIGARDDFLSIASHELKTPVATLQLQIQSMLRRATSEPEGLAISTVAERLAAADRQIARLTRLINELLDISRITGRGPDLELEAVELDAVVRDVVARNEDELSRARCSIVLRLSPSTGGTWDRLRVEQIVTNLLSNAVKYGAGRPIEVTVDGDETSARLTVRDEGIGIATEDQARIFQRFERAVSKSDYGGFGLGLWIVRQIVDAHGGKIHVSSEPGGGSTFSVELPRIPPGIQSGRPGDEGEPYTDSSRTAH